MRSRAFILTATALSLVLALAGGVYVYDRSGRDVIPEGVRVAGVDVGGLDAAAARSRLEGRLLAALRTPVRVYHGDKTFVLTPEQSGVATDLDAVVDRALAEADRGNLFTRSIRRLTGGELPTRITPETTYDKLRVVQFLDSIRASVDRDPIDAKVEFAASGLKFREGRVGLEVRASELHQQIRRAIVDPSADHTLVARTEHTKPEVGTEELERKYATALIVDRANFALKLYKDLELVKTYEVGLGMAGSETPTGEYSIANKAVDPVWTKPYSDWVPEAEQGTQVPGGSPDNPLKARWLGIYDGVGIHGIDPSLNGTIGTMASRGCVRMRIEEVEELYDQVPVGAPIYIA